MAASLLIVVFAAFFNAGMKTIGISGQVDMPETSEMIEMTDITEEEPVITRKYHEDLTRHHTMRRTTTTTVKVTQAPVANYTKKAYAAATVAPEKSVLLSVPYVNQMPKYPTGCEAACVTMLLRFWGYSVSLDTVVDSIPRGSIYEKDGKPYGPSIYGKFVGDPCHTYYDSDPGYGAFAPVVASCLKGFASGHRVKNITGSSVETLFDYLDQGCPVIVWATFGMAQPKKCNWWYVEGTDEYFEYPRGTHVYVLCGYKGNKVYLMDPYNSGQVSYSQSSFSSKYNLLGCQAVVMVPYESTTETTIENATAKETTLAESTTGKVTTAAEVTELSTTGEVTTAAEVTELSTTGKPTEKTTEISTEKTTDQTTGE